MPEGGSEAKLVPELYKVREGVTLDPNKIRLTEKSKELIKKGKVGQRYVINEYIDLKTGERIQHWWPTVLEEIKNENEHQKSKRIAQEKLIIEAGFDPSEVVKVPITGLTGVAHTRAKALDEKTFTGPSYAYIKQKKNRLGGSAVKSYDNNMDFIGRSTVNWDVFDLNDAFQYAYYYGPKNNLEPVTDTWPTGLVMARSLNWDVIQSWINEIERIKPELNKDTKSEAPPEHPQEVLQEAKNNCYPLIFPEVHDWKNLFELKEEERNAKLAELWGKTLYIASGLKTIKQSSVVLTEEDIVSETVKTAKKYGIKLDVDAIPKEIPNTYGATALMQAAYQGKNRVIKVLLKAGANINAKDHYGISVIDYAIRGNNPTTLKLLLKKTKGISTLAQMLLDNKPDNVKKVIESKIDIETKYTDTQFTAAHLAAIYGQTEALKILVEAKADCNCRDKFGRTPAHFAAMYGKVNMIDTLSELGKLNLEKDSILLNELAFLAAERGRLNIIELFIQKYGLSLEAVNKEGHTLAMVAAKFGKIHLLKNLAESKANLITENASGQSPLTLAIHIGDANIVELIASKTTINEETKRKAAFLAAAYGRTDILEILAPDFAAKNEYGATLATEAARTGNRKVLQYLIDKRANVMGPDGQGWTPLFIAASTGNTQIIEMIFAKFLINQEIRLALSFCAVEYGRYNIIEMLKPDLDARNQFGETFATKAIKYGHAKIIYYLLDKKADLTKPDGNGWTPLRMAAVYGNLQAFGAIASRIPIDPETKMQLAFLAAENGHVHIMHSMIPLDFAATNEKGETLATYAAKLGQTNVIQYLADQKVDFSAPDRNGETPAYVAARENKAEVIKLLEINNINLSAECNGLTPAHIASAYNQTKALFALFESRAGLYEVAEKTKDKDTPLQLAIKNRQFEAIQLLLDFDVASVYSQDWRTKTSPIDFADPEVKAFVTLHQLKKYITENKLVNEDKNNIPAEQMKRIAAAENKKDWVTALSDVIKLAEEKPKVEEKSIQPLLQHFTFAPPTASIASKEAMKTYLDFFASPEHLNKKLAEAEKKREEVRQSKRDFM